MRSFRSRYFILFSALLLAAVLPTALAASQPPADSTTHADGLTCFSIVLTTLAEKEKSLPSCDAMCAASAAACVGLQMNGAINPGLGCDDDLGQPKGGGIVASCRCCAVEH
jgi:hypothetical protein